VTAGGCLGILIPPSVLLIVYGATAGVSVVQLYAGAFLPGFMLAGLYIGYVILLAKWKPNLMPPLTAEQQRVPMPPALQELAAAGGACFRRFRARLPDGAPGRAPRTILMQMLVTFLPALAVVAILGVSYRISTAPESLASSGSLVQAGGAVAADSQDDSRYGSSVLRPPKARKAAGGSRAAAAPPRGGQGTRTAGAQPAQAAPAQATPAKPEASVERVPPGRSSTPCSRSAWLRCWSSTGCGTGSGCRSSSCC
jgi:hypothetical protein